MKLNSVIFHTSRLPELRSFYEETLQLPTGTYVRENQTVPDYSDNYVNYYLEGGLLGFETDTTRTDVGTVVLNVPDFDGLRLRLAGLGMKILESNDNYFKIKDPEGRSLIIEPVR
jgi:hypothetical protein